VSDALVRGNVGHLALATYYLALQRGAPKREAMLAGLKVIRQEVELYEPFDPEKMTADIRYILGEYWNNYDDTDLEILYVEAEQTVRLTDDFEMPLKVDLIARVPGYGVIAFDHKFVRNFYDVDALDLSPQLPKYYACLDALNIHVDGIWYNECRTWFTKDNKADTSLMFRRTPVSMSPKKVVTIMSEQIRAAQRIGRLKALPLDEWEKRVLRNPQACKMCSFTLLCAADLDGQDSELVKSSFYEERSYR
jgi:hypothetical protein